MKKTELEKRRKHLLFSAMTATALLTAGCLGAFAAEGAESSASDAQVLEAAQQGADSTAGEADAVKADDLVISLPDSELTVENLTGVHLAVRLEDYKAPEGEEAAAKMYTLTLTDEDKNEHVFENVDPSRWSDASAYIEDDFYLIRLKDQNGEWKLATENGEEKTFDKPVTRYVTNDVYIREEADFDSKPLSVAQLGSEVKVIAAAPRWCKVEQGDVTGYISRSCLSPDQKDADAAVSAEKAAIAAREAAAAAAAAAAAEEDYDDGGGAYEVGREQYPDCDGSGHGYYIVYYSDGSSSTEDY